MSSEYPLHEIAKLKEGMSRVVVEGRITERQRPKIVISPKTGEELTLTEVELSDDSGSVPLILWNEQAEQIQSDKIRIENGYMRKYRGRHQLSVSKWGLIISLI
ncbi:MAG: hypothetical protein KGY80_09750 [Candidatus Thorarchaeota archaeon]|nr:hypothetical protein [Candidatus Thorarchaeota archaeon]